MQTQLYGIIFMAFLLFAGGAVAQALTSEQAASWDSGVSALFDAQGNLINPSLYDDGFVQFSQRFQTLPWPVKSIFNNQRIQVNFQLSPALTKRFGIVMKDETLQSFTMGSLPNSTMEVDLDVQTYEENREKKGFEAGFPELIKDGRIRIESKDFIHSIMIGIYKLFI